MAGGGPPVRGRAAIERHYAGSGGPLALRALAYSTEGGVGYILGGFARRKGESDIGKFTLTLRRAPEGRWLIVSDMDNGNGSPVPLAPRIPYAATDVDTAHGDREFHLLWPEGAPGALGTGPADKPKLTVYRAAPESATGAAVDRLPRRRLRAARRGPRGAPVRRVVQLAGRDRLRAAVPPGPALPPPGAAPGRPARDPAGARARGRVGRRSRRASASSASRRAGTSPRPPPRTSTTGRPDAADPVERQGSRPDFAVLAYPVVSLFDPPAHSGSRRNLLGEPADPALVELLSNERQVTARTPPTFLFHTADDASVPVANSLLFFEALQKAGVPAELHVFAHGKHGVGLAASDPALSSWPRLCATWMDGLGLLKPKS